MDERNYRVGLSYVAGLGPRKFMALLAYFGSAQNIWNSEADELAVVVGQKLAYRIVEHRRNFDLERELEKMQKLNVRVLLPEDSEYPVNLLNIYDPPFILYIKGEVHKEDNIAISIVGSRRCTPYGLTSARRLAKELAEQGVCVVSGMARGIDSAAHWGALEGSGRTLAVLGCGLDCCYPPENHRLMEKIVEHGAVLSEFPLGVRPMPQNFPARNRIISGLSKGVLVVEAAEKSGALITADFALDQGREVFALPGNITNANSRGTNKLIQQGAKLIQKASDILEEIGFSCQEIKDNKEEECSDPYEAVMKILDEPLHFEILLERLNIFPGQLQSILMQLELAGKVKQLPGNIFTRI